MDERISLLSSIFTNHNEVESAEHLSGDDAQAFVDVVAEVCFHALPPPKNLSVDSN